MVSGHFTKSYIVSWAYFPSAMIVKVMLYPSSSNSDVSKVKDLHAVEASGVPGQPG